jgi:hypothetical protein
VQLPGPLKRRHRLVDPSELGERVAESIVDVGDLRAQLRQAAEMRRRLPMGSTLLCDHPEQMQTARVVLVARQHGATAGFGLKQLAQPMVLDGLREQGAGTCRRGGARRPVLACGAALLAVHRGDSSGADRGAHFTGPQRHVMLGSSRVQLRHCKICIPDQDPFKVRALCSTWSATASHAIREWRDRSDGAAAKPAGPDKNCRVAERMGFEPMIRLLTV